MCLDLREDSVLDGIAGGIKKGVGDLDPLSIHLLLLIHIHSNHPLVDPKEVDDRMVLMYKDVGASRNLTMPCYGISSSMGVAAEPCSCMQNNF
jgi:hypothetical protein